MADTFANHKYLNLTIVGDLTKQYTEAIYNSNFNTPILEHVGSWKVAISRFEISRMTFPIFIFIDGLYKFSLQFGSSYITQTLALTDLNVPSGAPQTYYSIDPSLKNYIYNINQFIDALNYASSLAFAQLLIAEPTITATQGPFFYFDDNLELFHMVVQTAYLTDNIGIYMNNALYNYFSGLPSVLIDRSILNDLNYQLIYSNLYNNNYYPSPYTASTQIQMQQNYSSIPNWFLYKKIIFYTNIQIDSENFNILTNDTVMNVDRIFTDYDLVFTSIKQYNQPITFSAVLFRFLDFDEKLTNSLQAFNYKLKLRDKFGQDSSYILFSGDFVSVKFIFEKSRIIDHIEDIRNSI